MYLCICRLYSYLRMWWVQIWEIHSDLWWIYVSFNRWQSLQQFEIRPTWRSILMEQCNIPPNMPWNFSQTPRVNHLRHIPTTHFQESAETKDADTHPSTRSLEGNKELEYMLMAPNDEAQERRICCNQSASSSMIGESLLSSFYLPFLIICWDYEISYVQPWIAFKWFIYVVVIRHACV